MNNKPLASMVVAVVATVLAVAGSAIAYRALSAAQNAEAASKKSLLAMEERLHQLELRLATRGESVPARARGGDACRPGSIDSKKSSAARGWTACRTPEK